MPRGALTGVALVGAAVIAGTVLAVATLGGDADSKPGFPEPVAQANSTIRNSPVPPSPKPAREVTYPFRNWVDAPTIDPSPGGWWCVCYVTQQGSNHTACRRQVGTCEELRSMIQERGSSEIQRGSATECRHVGAPYPWVELGHAAAWRESAHSGAAQATGVCALR